MTTVATPPAPPDPTGSPTVAPPPPPGSVEPPAPGSVEPHAPVEPQAPGVTPEHSGHGRSTGRLVVICVLATVVLLMLLDMLIGRMTYSLRQDHLGDVYSDTKVKATGAGAPLMVLQSKDTELNVVVVDGATPAQLRGAAGLVAGTPMPGHGGNTVVMGRSSRFGGPFSSLGEMRKGDMVVVRARSGELYSFKVTSKKVVGNARVKVLTTQSTPTLTLVTSAGGPLNGRRLVVVAEAQGTQAAPSIDRPVGRTPAPDAFDQRAGDSAILLLVGILVIVLGVAAIPDLRRRFSTSTVVVVAGPAIALGVVLLLFNLDAILPVTY